MPGVSRFFIMEFVNSGKSKLLIIYWGFQFRFHKTLKDGSQRWSCCAENCKCFLKLYSLNKIVESNTDHKHGKTDEKVLNRQILCCKWNLRWCDVQTLSQEFYSTFYHRWP